MDVNRVNAQWFVNMLLPTGRIANLRCGNRLYIVYSYISLGVNIIRENWCVGHSLIISWREKQKKPMTRKSMDEIKRD